MLSISAMIEQMDACIFHSPKIVASKETAWLVYLEGGFCMLH